MGWWCLPSMDGHPADAFSPGTSYDYEYRIRQRAGVNWYHPHPHGGTGRQVWRGMAGLLIVEDPATERDLPSGDREIPLLLGDGLLDRSTSRSCRAAEAGGVSSRGSRAGRTRFCSRIESGWRSQSASIPTGASTCFTATSWSTKTPG